MRRLRPQALRQAAPGDRPLPALLARAARPAKRSGTTSTATTNYKAKVAAQGGDGALTRLSMLALFAIGLLGAILLLGLARDPPLHPGGDRLRPPARRALRPLLPAARRLGPARLQDLGADPARRGPRQGDLRRLPLDRPARHRDPRPRRRPGRQRHRLPALLRLHLGGLPQARRADRLLSIGEHERRRHRRPRRLSPPSASRRRSRAAPATASAASPAAARSWRRERRTLGAEATRETAKGSLHEGARALADQRYREARETVAAHEAGVATRTDVSQRPGRAPRPADRVRDPSSKNERDARRRRRPRLPRRGALRAPQSGCSSGAERNQQRRSACAGASETSSASRPRTASCFERSRDPADHAHRAGYERAQFESLRGPERERAEAEIEKARRRDLKRLAVTAEPPGRIVGRARARRRAAAPAPRGGGAPRRLRVAERPLAPTPSAGALTRRANELALLSPPAPRRSSAAAAPSRRPRSTCDGPATWPRRAARAHRSSPSEAGPRPGFGLLLTSRPPESPARPPGRASAARSSAASRSGQARRAPRDLLARRPPRALSPLSCAAAGVLAPLRPSGDPARAPPVGGAATRPGPRPLGASRCSACSSSGLFVASAPDSGQECTLARLRAGRHTCRASAR